MLVMVKRLHGQAQPHRLGHCREFQPALDAALARPGVSADAVADAGGLDRKGWSWPLYAPLSAIAVDAGLSIVAINLSWQRTREIARLGFAALGPGVAEELALERHWTAHNRRSR